MRDRLDFAGKYTLVTGRSRGSEKSSQSTRSRSAQRDSALLRLVPRPLAAALSGRIYRGALPEDRPYTLTIARG